MNGSMSKARYYVVYDGAWRIQCDGENSEPYGHRNEAFRDAVALAHLDGRNGRLADVIVQGDGDLFRSEWDSVRDTYPPPLVPEIIDADEAIPKMAGASLRRRSRQGAFKRTGVFERSGCRLASAKRVKTKI